MLVGIAKLAAESPILEAKRQVWYFDLPIRSLVNRARPGMPFQWTVNPYRGCEFACKYCYARYTHEFMGMEDPQEFEDKIFAKRAAAETLRRDLKKVPIEEAIAIGTATDPYQPAERRYGTTRSVLEALSQERGRRLSLTTKSDLVVRDVELLREIARRNILHVNLTITTLDADLARMLEPRAPLPGLRLEALARLVAAGIRAGVFANPVLPLITDSEENLDSIAREASRVGAHHFNGGLVFLMPYAQKVFFPFLEQRFPEVVQRYRVRFGANPHLRGPYHQMIQGRIARIRKRYGLAGTAIEYQPDASESGKQLTLF